MSSDLLTLQNRMKRDPQGYREEFLQQLRHFFSNLQIFKLQPLAKVGRSDANTAEILNSVETKSEQKKSKGQSTEPPLTQAAIQSRRIHEFCSLINFISHTAPLYREEIKGLNIPQELFALLHQYCESLDPFLRKTLVQALVLLQNRDLIRRTDLLPALFRIFRCADKELRSTVFSHIVSDIQRLYKQPVSFNTTTELQKLVFTMLKDDHPGVALRAIHVLVELWKRNVWTNDKVVNAIGTMCFTTDDKLMSAALHFFLGNYDTTDEEEAEKHKDAVSKQKEMMNMMTSLKHVKRKVKKTREIERMQKKIDPILGQYEGDSDEEKEVKNNLNPLALLFDSQHYAERLFAKLRSSRETFATRLLIMDVLSRLIGMNKLLIFNFYPFIQRYLQPHQKDVTKLLVYIARAVHSLVPPEVLSPVVKTIATHFVNDRSLPESAAIGINAIREICARAPLVMSQDLLHDLSEYAKHKNKGIFTAARSLIQIFRQLNPALLRAKDRGRDASIALLIQRSEDPMAKEAREMAAAQLEYGGHYAYKDLDGLDVLKEAGVLERQVEENDWDYKHTPEDDLELLADNDSEEEMKLTKQQRRKLRDLKGPKLFDYRKKLLSEGYILPGSKKNIDNTDNHEEEDVREMSLEDLFEGEDIDMNENGLDLDEDDIDIDEDSLDIENDIDMEEMDMEDMEMDDMDMEDFEMEELSPPKSTRSIVKPQPKQSKSPAIKPVTTETVQLTPIKRTAEQQAPTQPSKPLASLRILTPADFKLLEEARKKKILAGMVGKRKLQKEMLKEDILQEVEYTAAMAQGLYQELDSDDLHSQHFKRRRTDKVDRLSSVYAGRELVMAGREGVKFGQKSKADTGGLTNEEKLKSKNFLMVKHSSRVQSKATKSFKQKQRGTNEHIKSLRKMSKNVKKKVRSRKV